MPHHGFMTKTLPFTRADMARAKTKLLRDGRIANAVVTRVELDGTAWTVKDFSSRPWYVRYTVAPFLLRRELSILARLHGVDGIAEQSFRIDQFAIAVSFMEGANIGQVPPATVTPSYLEAFEKLLQTMHHRGVVHLDVRGAGNVIVQPDGKPGLIDFQASLYTGWMPNWLRRLLEDFDMSGALKKWLKYQPEAMGDERRQELERINRLRRFWIFRGYFGLKKD